MPDTLLTPLQKKNILSSIGNKDFRKIISILESVKTSHAGTAKTKDKRFVVTSIVKHILDKTKGSKENENEKLFYKYGIEFNKMEEPAAKQISISLIWRAYNFNKRIVKEILLDIADNDNWEVRETAGSVFASTLYYNPDFYSTLKKWAKHPSGRIRRAVVISALGLLEKGRKEKLPFAFDLLEPLMYDDDVYVKKCLGPFVLGSYFGNNFPEEVFSKLEHWLKIKDENFRWNIVMAFHNSFGLKYKSKAIKVVNILKEDKSQSVQRAVRSTLNFLNKNE